MADPTETVPDSDRESISIAVSLMLIDRCIASLEARCNRQAALVADLLARGEDTCDAEASLKELERGLMLLEAQRRGLGPSSRNQTYRISAPRRREPHQP